MPAVTLARYAPALNDKVNVIYWQTSEGTAHYITLDLDWYDITKVGPQAAVRRFVKGFDFKGVNFQFMGRMYEVPNGTSICENESGSPFKPYGSGE